MDKYQFAENLINQVREIPIDNILGNYVLIHQRSGVHKEALCPFHNDKKLGSFKVTPSKGMWYCFTCETGGDSISFVKEYYGLEYMPAIFKIGVEFGLISQSDYEEYFEKRRFNADKVNKIQKKYEDMDLKKQKEMQGERANVKILNEVYRLFISYTKLSDTHNKHLSEERKLSEIEIKEHMFFSFPTRRILTKLLNDIKKKYGSVEILGTVPGFFKEKESGKYVFVRTNGIGLPIFDLDENIIGIQIRKDEEPKNECEKNNRYMWFGSSFANGHEKLSNGTSSGSPIDVIVPNDVRGRTIFITEGKFKGIALAKKTKSIVLDVAGVSTWRGITDVIRRLNNNERINNAFTGGDVFNVKFVNIAYDADLSYNPAVFQQQKKMADVLTYHENLTVFYLYWDSKVAKGIDDLFNLEQGHLVKRYDRSKFNKDYANMLKIVMEENPQYEKLAKVPHEVIDEYFNKHMDLVPLDKKEY